MFQNVYNRKLYNGKLNLWMCRPSLRRTLYTIGYFRESYIRDILGFIFVIRQCFLWKVIFPTEFRLLRAEVPDEHTPYPHTDRSGTHSIPAASIVRPLLLFLQFVVHSVVCTVA